MKRVIVSVVALGLAAVVVPSAHATRAGGVTTPGATAPVPTHGVAASPFLRTSFTPGRGPSLLAMLTRKSPALAARLNAAARQALSQRHLGDRYTATAAACEPNIAPNADTFDAMVTNTDCSSWPIEEANYEIHLTSVLGFPNTAITGTFFSDVLAEPATTTSTPSVLYSSSSATFNDHDGHGPWSVFSAAGNGADAGATPDAPDNDFTDNDEQPGTDYRAGTEWSGVGQVPTFSSNVCVGPVCLPFGYTDRITMKMTGTWTDSDFPQLPYSKCYGLEVTWSSIIEIPNGVGWDPNSVSGGFC